MDIRVALLPNLLPEDLQNSTVLVIDTLRFTTTACVALASGASSVRVTAEIQEAVALREQDPALLLCGERECRPIQGFDLGNSPAEYAPDQVSNRHLVFTTTNGTRAVAAAIKAHEIWLAALVNRKSVCDALTASQQNATTGQRVWIVCAGTDQAIAAEDVLAAGAILDQLGVAPRDDGGLLALGHWKRVQAAAKVRGLPLAIEESFQVSLGGVNLLESGYADDLVTAARIDSLAVCPTNLQPELEPEERRVFRSLHRVNQL